MAFERFHEALRLVMQHHASHVDKAGVPYIMHLTRVAGYVAEAYPGDRMEDLMITALLHDIIEDCKYPSQGIQIIFGDEIAEAVCVLSKKPGQGYDDYIDGILGNYLAIRVKLWDLRHNMDASRLQNVVEPQEKRMKRLAKYSKAYQRILIKMEEDTADVGSTVQ